MGKYKDLYGYEGLYKISTNGDILKQNGNVVLTHTSKNGYLIANLTKNKKVKTEYVHRLVALTFIQNELQLKTVNHIDGNKLNNEISNLEWATHSENTKHAFRTGLQNNRHPKPNHRKAVRAISVIDGTTRDFSGVSVAADALGIASQWVSACLGGRRKTSKGWRWEYL